MDTELILRNNLKQARQEKKLSQSELAKLVGVSRQTICSIETGVFNPTAKLALILCIALDKKFEDLFKGWQLMTPPILSVNRIGGVRKNIVHYYL